MTHQPQSSILIVDDEPGVRIILRRVAEREGYEALEAGSGAEGLAMLAEATDSVALIFLDLRMPGMDGFAFRIKQLSSPVAARVPTIVVTGQSISPEDFGRLQPVACLVNPATLSQLQAAIRCHARTPPPSAPVHAMSPAHAVA